MEDVYLYKRVHSVQISKVQIENSSSRDSNAATDDSSKQTSLDETPTFMRETLKDLSPRWRNWWVRLSFSILMIGMFATIIYFGTFAILIGVIFCQVKCFHEIITIGHQVYKSYDLPWFRTLSWYFLICTNYFFYGESLAGYFDALITQEECLFFLARYHRMISYLLYLAGIMLFVWSLVKSHYRFQFYMFAWTHVTLLIIVTQSYLFMQNLMQGLIWLLVPVSLVICNDIMAYAFGFFFGRTPLIKLSPKKTWEGFIGGGIATVVFGWFLSSFLCHFPSLTCPIVVSSTFTFDTVCAPSYFFNLQLYELPRFLRLFGFGPTVYLYPFQFHSLTISIFASLVAPFGGFFASGFKRAFKIKDFSDTIPGHGGVMDRLDCQYLMATFVNVYIHTFVRVSSPKSVLSLVTSMPRRDQLRLLNELKVLLDDEGLA